MTTHAAWPDLYRPSSLDEMALPPELRAHFGRLMAGPSLPRHLVLHGTPGCGKTTITRLLARLYEDDGLPRVMRVSATQTGNVQYIRETVISAMRGGRGPRLIVFEEASGLSDEAQRALRVPLEDLAHRCSVIFVMNELDDLDPAIRSRCDVILMTRPPLDECARVLEQILDKESVAFTPRDVMAFVRDHFGQADDADLRSLLRAAQDAVVGGEFPKAAPEQVGRTVAFDHWPLPSSGPYETDGARLLDDLRVTFEQHLGLVDGGAEALALWTVFAWAHEAFTVSPLLTLVSPTMRAGKTTAFELLEQLLPRGLTHLSSSSSPATIYQRGGMVDDKISNFPPSEVTPPRLCLLLDEADGWLSIHKEIRSILNSGHRRRAAFVERMDRTGHAARYRTFYPKALALIEGPRTPLPATLRDRSILVPMRRLKPSEIRAPLPRHGFAPEFIVLQERIESWVGLNFAEIRDTAWDELLALETLSHRARDNWQPLMAIARVAGGDWEERARRVSLVLNESGKHAELLVDLLSEIRDVLESGDSNKIRTASLVGHLRDSEEGAWKGLGAHRLADMLRPLGIRPKQLWTDGAAKKSSYRGYERSDFADAFDRYLGGGGT